MKKIPALLLLAILAVALLDGCGTKLGRGMVESINTTKEGLTDTTTNIEDQLSKSCKDTLKVSEDADEVLRLVSSEEKTKFTVDGKLMGEAKQLRVCINSKAKHTVVAEPLGCEKKTENLSPPYDFPIYEFRYMMAECTVAATTPPPARSTTNTPRRHSPR